MDPHELLSFPFCSVGGIRHRFRRNRLGIASEIFARLKKTHVVGQVLECLPGANCGGCGYPGCGGLCNSNR